MIVQKYLGGRIWHYTLYNNDISVGIENLGAAITERKVGGVDVVLGFNTAEDRVASGTYAGATIGRAANRIAGGTFVIGGKRHSLPCNDGANHLHGGNSGFDKKLFVLTESTYSSLTLSCVSPDGEEGYPGTLKFSVKYTLAGKVLRMDYFAVSDRNTLWCPTNHTYFNLNGEDSGDCRNNILQLNADSYTPAGDDLIPTSEVLPVKGTPFDFLKAKPIIADFKNPALRVTNGYDNNFIANGNDMAFAYSNKTGISLCVSSDMPCFQLYTGGAIKPCKGKSRKYGAWSGFCIEPQFCPNAINLKNFDKPIIYGDKRYEHYIKYTFSISG